MPGAQARFCVDRPGDWRIGRFGLGSARASRHHPAPASRPAPAVDDRLDRGYDGEIRDGPIAPASDGEPRGASRCSGSTAVPGWCRGVPSAWSAEAPPAAEAGRRRRGSTNTSRYRMACARLQAHPLFSCRRHMAQHSVLRSQAWQRLLLLDERSAPPPKRNPAPVAGRVLASASTCITTLLIARRRRGGSPYDRVLEGAVRRRIRQVVEVGGLAHPRATRLQLPAAPAREKLLHRN